MSHQTEIQITEEFDNELGHFEHYDTYDNTLRATVADQAHLDIRSFVSTPWTTAGTVSELEGMTMGGLEGLQVGTLDDAQVVVDDENWTGTGVIAGPDPVRNNWNLLQMTLATGANVATSSMPNDPVALKRFPRVPGDPGPDGIWPENLNDNDYVIVALPGFPLASVNLAQSAIYFTSAADGSFTDASRLSLLPFDYSIVPLINGNCEGRWLRANVESNGGINFKIDNITGVQFRVTATGVATFKAGGLRVVSRNWKYMPVDIDTRYKVLRRTVSRTGLTTEPYDASMPILWRSDDPSSPADPRPVDAKLGVTFNTGALSQTNQVSIYMRETNKDFLTQLDLNSTSQNALNGNPQPDIGEAMWNPRPQTDLERYDQDELNTEIQYTLERTPDALSSSYVEFVFQWSSSSGTIHIRNSEGNGYTFTVSGLVANTNYIVLTELEGTAARAVLYPIDGAGNIDITNRLYDTGWIDDDFVFKRRQGRIGWYAQLLDGDAYVDGIRTRGLSFAEQRLLPMESITPVDGAQLFAEFSPDKELSLGVDGRNGAIVALDNAAGQKETYKVSVTGAGQGIHTNVIVFNNFDETDVKFDLLVPTTAITGGAGLRAFLTNDAGREVSLNLGPIIAGQWTSKHIPLDTLGDQIQTGSYRLAIVNNSSTSFSFWVNKPISIRERTVTWSGRAVVDDPWKSNDAKWVDFRDQVNDHRSGVTFYKRGNQLQVRGRALRQDAHIGKIKVKPQYAQLGRLVFDDPPVNPPLGENPDTLNPYAVQVTPWGGLTVGVGVSPDIFTNPIALYEWSFGDGVTDLGRFAVHTYQRVGTYPVTLTAIDIYGQRETLIGTATV